MKRDIDLIRKILLRGEQDEAQQRPHDCLQTSFEFHVELMIEAELVDGFVQPLIRGPGVSWQCSERREAPCSASMVALALPPQATHPLSHRGLSCSR